MSERRCENCRHAGQPVDGKDCGPCLSAGVDEYPKWQPIQPAAVTATAAAPAILHAAAGHMEQRAATYDAPSGERSMQRTVAAFNAITGRDITESEGWLLMQVLKDVRDRQRQQPHQDSLEDCVAYAALKAEARLKEKK